MQTGFGDFVGKTANAKPGAGHGLRRDHQDYKGNTAQAEPDGNQCSAQEHDVPFWRVIELPGEPVEKYGLANQRSKSSEQHGFIPLPEF